MPNTPCNIDFSKIDFPTDKLTFGQLRRRAANQAAFANLLQAELVDVDAFQVHCFEQTLAAKAVAKTVNAPDPDPTIDQASLISYLDEGYQELGLSTGIQQTRQLIRAIEDAACREAGFPRTRRSK